MKPLVGANARGTFRIRRGASLTGATDFYVGQRYLAQPFVSSVLTAGEVSLFYFSGEFSHAITKTPKPGDFRVQEEHGGALELSSAQPACLKAAERALAAVPWPLLYARVDLVWHDSAWLLMELELVEPSLYFTLDAASPERFARALVNTL